MTDCVIAVGDSSEADSVSLMNITSDGGVWLVGGAEAVKMPPPTVRRYHSRTKGNAASVDTTRTISLQIHIQSNTSSDVVWGTVHALRKKFRQARRAYGAGTAMLGTGVSLWYRANSNVQYTYFDVLDGEFLIDKQDFGAAYVIEGTITLLCLPLGRGQSVTLPVSATITNGILSSYYVPVTIPGDEGAICQIALTNLSGAINRVRLGRRSLDGMQAGDFVSVVTPQAAGGAVGHFSDAPSIGGIYYQITPGYIWQDVALFASPPPTPLTHGDIDVLVRARDHTAFVGQPINLFAAGSSAAGSLSAASLYTYTMQIAERDAGGQIGPWSDPVSYYLNSGETEIVLTWTSTGTPSGHELLVTWGTWGVSGGVAVFTPTGTQYLSTGSTSPTYTITAVSNGGTSPQPSFIAPVEMVLGAAVGAVGPTLPNSQYVWGDPFTAQLGGSRYEVRYAGTFTLPPVAQQEGQAVQPFQLKLQAQVQPGQAVGAALDANVVIFLPHDEPHTVLEYPGLTNAVLYTWLIDTRRDERVSCNLLTSGVVQQVVTAEGPFFLAPGGNMIVICVEGAAGVHDNTSTFTVQVTYAPRYADPIAEGW